MKLSVPIYRLKHLARQMARAKRIPLHAALDRIAAAEGFASWSHLSAALADTTPARKLLDQLQPGELMLVGARPGHGKTRLCLEMALEALRRGRHAAFFTFEFGLREIVDLVRTMDDDMAAFNDRFLIDNSDAICSRHIVDRLANAEPGTVVVIDYLQVLDQRRETPDLATQVRELKAFAAARALNVVFISQIGPQYDAKEKACPDIGDVRLPNPLELGVFDRTCFLHAEKVEIGAVG